MDQSRQTFRRLDLPTLYRECSFATLGCCDCDKFDWRLCAPLVVSKRSNETLVIIDGQHRWLAASQRDDIPYLPCCVFVYGDTQEEARMFIVANRARKPMSRLDDLSAAIAAQDEDALELQQVVLSAGLRIARNTASTAWEAGEVAFTSSIASAIRRHGASLASNALTNIAEAFPDQKLNHGGAIFGGLVQIMSDETIAYDADRLIAALQTRTTDEWGAAAAGLSGGDRRTRALRDAITAAYQEVGES